MTMGFSSNLNVLAISSTPKSLRHFSQSVNIMNAFATSNLRARRKRSLESSVGGYSMGNVRGTDHPFSQCSLHPEVVCERHRVFVVGLQ